MSLLCDFSNVPGLNEIKANKLCIVLVAMMKLDLRMEGSRHTAMYKKVTKKKENIND